MLLSQSFSETQLQHINDAIVLSGTDGIITIFNILIGMTSADLNKNTIFIVTILAIIGDAISMGISWYNSKELNEDIDKQEQSIAAVYNTISFIVFGSMVLGIYLLVTDKPSVVNAYIAIIVPLILLGYYQYTQKNDINLIYNTVLFGFVGSIIVFSIGKIIKKYK